MTTVGRTHLAAVLESLEREAKHCGLMGEDEKLSYEKGSRVNGITAKLWVGQRGSHAPFVPKFTLRHTQREQLIMMESVAYALHSLRMSKIK